MIEGFFAVAAPLLAALGLVLIAAISFALGVLSGDKLSDQIERIATHPPGETDQLTASVARGDAPPPASFYGSPRSIAAATSSASRRGHQAHQVNHCAPCARARLAFRRFLTRAARRQA